MLDIDLVDRAGGGVSHVAEDGEDDTRAEDATVSKLLTDRYVANYQRSNSSLKW